MKRATSLDALVVALLFAFVPGVRGSATPGNATVFFERFVLTDDWVGDYGLRKVDVNADGNMDIVAYAWASGMVAWFDNPAWTEHLVAKLPGVVDVDFADLNGDGLLDFVVAWDLNIPPQSEHEGQIGWLANQAAAGAWKYRPIADPSNYIPGVHRVRIGEFFEGRVGVVGVPIFDFGAAPEYFNQTPCTIRYYEMPADAATRKTAWNDSFVLSSELHVCHTLSDRADPQSGRLFLLENSLEGVTRIDFGNDTAELTNLSPGMPAVSWSPFRGSQGMSVGYVDGHPAFMAQIAPWEGVDVLSPAVVAVLTPSSPSSSVFEPPLNRTQLDVLGPQGHDVATGDFNGDGCDDFLVGLRGPVKGVWMFQCLDKSDLTKWSFFPVTLDESYGASQLVTHDFNGDGKLDWAATGFPGFSGSGGDHYVAIYFQK